MKPFFTSVALILACGCLERGLAPLNPCLVSGVTATVAVTNIDKVDLLFMIDDSTSMQDKQHALRMQMPHVMQVLTTGDIDGDGVQDFPPPKDMHIGVVSSDMGLRGVDGIPNCSTDGGDDGLLQHQPHPMYVQGCQSSYPPFLSFLSSIDSPTQVSTDFACIAALGTDGCGLEQQLESPLKALWPSIDPMPDPTTHMNRIVFLADPQTGQGKLGHGDVENAGFLRNDPVLGLSLIAIIVLTDEDDSSLDDTSKYLPPSYLDPNDPLVAQPLNLRPIYNQGSLYPIARYINGFKALRPGNENLVVFGAITGVPPELVDQSAYDKLDWTDAAQRGDFYRGILADPRMTPIPQPSTLTDNSGGLLMPCCRSSVGTAVPGNRVVQVAQGFGANGAVYSICQDDYAPALDGIISIIAKQLGAVCLPRTLVRNSSGLVGCNVVWELPPEGSAPANTPTSCHAQNYDFLLDPDSGESKVTDQGGAICKVAQLAVQDDPMAPGMKTVVPTMTGTQTFSQGWYYDDFSTDVQKGCQGASKQRVAFSTMAKPPSGVTVKLECLNERQTLTDDRIDLLAGVDQPAVGDACDHVTRNGETLTGDDACAARLAKPSKRWPDSVDHSMFCHPKLNTCVLACNTDSDCPSAWVCDRRPETLAATSRAGHANGTPICINPTCGDVQ